MRHCSALTIVVLAMLALSAPATAVTLQLSAMVGSGSELARAATYFGQRVGQLSGGKIEIELNVDGELGDNAAGLSALQRGTLALTMVPASALADIFPRIELLRLPYLFENDDHFWWYVTGARAGALTQELRRQGIRLLGWLDLGGYGFAGGTTALAGVDDFAGRRIRVTGSSIGPATVEALGGTAVPLELSEVFVALQTGVIDGAEIWPQLAASLRYDEVAAWYTHDEHIRLPYLLLVSQSIYAERPTKQRQALRQAGALAQAYQRGAQDTAERRSLQDLADEDVEIITPARAPFVAAVEKLVEAEAIRLNVVEEVDYIREHAADF